MLVEQFRRWSALLSESVFLVGEDGRVLDANEPACRLVAGPEPLTGRSLFDWVAGEPDELRDFMHSCSQAPSRMSTPLELQSGDGSHAASFHCEGLEATPAGDGGPRTLLVKLTPASTLGTSCGTSVAGNSEDSGQTQNNPAATSLPSVLSNSSQNSLTDRKRNEAIVAAQKRALELLVNNAPLADVLDALCEVIEGQSSEKLIATVLLLDEEGLHMHSTAGRRAFKAGTF